MELVSSANRRRSSFPVPCFRVVAVMARATPPTCPRWSARPEGRDRVSTSVRSARRCRSAASSVTRTRERSAAGGFRLQADLAVVDDVGHRQLHLVAARDPRVLEVAGQHVDQLRRSRPPPPGTSRVRTGSIISILAAMVFAMSSLVRTTKVPERVPVKPSRPITWSANVEVPRRLASIVLRRAGTPSSRGSRVPTAAGCRSGAVPASGSSWGVPGCLRGRGRFTSGTGR
jgi:hypothetical protein